MTLRKCHNLPVTLTGERVAMPRRAVESPVARYRRAKWQARLAGGRLPGGFVADLDLIERRDRRALLDHAAAHPVFTATAWGDVWVCVVGTERCRRLLAAHRSSLTPYTFQIGELVPGGFMRQMAGEMHTHYRGLLIAALRQVPLAACEPAVVASWVESLEALRSSSTADDPEALVRTLSLLTTDALAAYVLGAFPGTEYHAALRRGYDTLGARGNAWTIGDPQRQGFADILDAVQAARAAGDVAPSLLQAIDRVDGGVDDTMLGNLIYMVELGRFDMRAFFRWLLRFAVHETAEAEVVRAAAEPVQAASDFVYEALRLEQSERLARVVDRTFRFEGRVIPKGTMLRLCMWESHKDADVFPDPFRFDSARQRGSDTELRRHFSPFGLDHHVCPFEAVSVRLAALFLATVLQRYSLGLVDDGPPVRGGYHFEPSPRFAVRFDERSDSLLDHLPPSNGHM